MKKQNVKTLARECLKLQEKIIKDVREIRAAEQSLDSWDKNYTELPREVAEARAHLAECQKAVDAALEQLSKPLEDYRYESRYYGYNHTGPRRYHSPAAQTAWEETRQTEHAADHLALMEAEAAKTLEEYTKLAREGLETAWQTWHDHNTLLTAKAAQIRLILKRDVLNFSELATDAPKKTEDPEPETCKLHHVDSPYVKAHAEEMYKAAKEIKITKESKLPVLNHILVRVTDDGLKLFTRTLEEDKARVQTVNCWADGVRWETCVPAKPFTDWLGVMAQYKETLVMDFDPQIQTLKIRTPDSRTEFKCLDACEFPPC